MNKEVRKVLAFCSFLNMTWWNIHRVCFLRYLPFIVIPLSLTFASECFGQGIAELNIPCKGNVTDHQGNFRVVVGPDGETEEVSHYYPYGALMGESRSATNQPYKYNGKELDRMFGLDWYDYGARMYDPVLGRWMTMDPMATNYYDVSPYAYCNNTTVNAIDPNGQIVIALDADARQNILNTLDGIEEKYVQFDKNGVLNATLLDKYDGSSANFDALKELSKSPTNYIFSVADKDINGIPFYEKGDNKDYPDNYSYGVTNFPKADNGPSPDENVYIFTANFLDKRLQARNTAHEGYGHAYFYELRKSNPNIIPSHTFGKVETVEEYDPIYKIYVQITIFGKNNTELERRIKLVEDEAIKNFDKKHTK